MLDIPILIENTDKQLTNEEVSIELGLRTPIVPNATKDDVRWKYSRKCKFCVAP